MAQHTIWVEGYPKPYTNANAVLLATIEAENFQGACLELTKQDEMFGKYYDRRKSSFMGCRVFSSEEKARAKWG